MLTELAILEGFLLVLCLARWSRRVNNGHYKGSCDPAMDAFAAFWLYLLLGLVPVVNLAFLVGAWLGDRDLREAQQARERDTVQDDVRAMTAKK